MGKMRIKVIFSPSSAMYMPEFGKLCLSEGFSTVLFSQESRGGAGPHASGAGALFPRAARTVDFCLPSDPPRVGQLRDISP